LQQWLAEQPDLTLAELAERLDQSLHIQVSLSRLCKGLKELGLPRKKVAPCHRARQRASDTGACRMPFPKTTAAMSPFSAPCLAKGSMRS
jgi:hypothetical protein